MIILDYKAAKMAIAVFLQSNLENCFEIVIKLKNNVGKILAIFYKNS